MKMTCKKNLGFATLLIISFLFSPLAEAQNGAFSFDGIDDYIVYESGMHFSDLESPSGSTFEITFRIANINSGAVLISQENGTTGIVNGFGFDSVGMLYHLLNGEQLEVESVILEPDVCYHLSITYQNSETNYYVNGNLVFNGPGLPGFPLYTNDDSFYFGSSPSLSNSYFEGLIGEVRLFGDIRTPLEIAANAIASIDYYNDNLFACFDFNVTHGLYTEGKFGFDHVLGSLGNGDISFAPIWTNDICIIESEPESVSDTACQTPPLNCLNNNPLELLCNGDFDQYCGALLSSHPMWGGTPLPAGLHPHHAFAWFRNPQYRTTFVGSDVPNWSPLYTQFPPTSSSFFLSNDFYVPFGLGSENGDYNINFSGIQNPPPTTWRGAPNGSGMIGMLGNGSNRKGEGIKTRLDHNHILLPGTDYVFSGWFYLTTAVNNPPSAPGEIQISFDNGTSEFIAGTATIQFENIVPSNNHWQFITINFRTPQNLASGMNFFRLRNISQTSPINQLDYYAFADDLSLRQVLPPEIFPQYIFTGDDNNDHHHRLVRVDDNGNVFTAVNTESTNAAITAEVGLPAVDTYNLSWQKGTILVKYSPVGELFWSKYFDGFQIVDIDFDEDDDLVAVGHSFDNQQSAGTSPAVTMANCPPTLFTDYETIQLVFARINSNNGSTSMIFNAGGAAEEMATGVTVIGNIAYIPVAVKPANCGNVVPELNWGSGAPISNSTILSFDLSTNIRINPFFNYPVAFQNPMSIKPDGNGGFFALTDEYLYHAGVAVPGVTLSAVRLANPDPTYMEPQFGTGNAYVLYRNDSRIEFYNNIGLIGFFTTDPATKPIAATSSSQGDYIMYNKPSSVGADPNPIVIAIEKLNLTGIFGSAIWTRESYGSFSSMVNSYQSLENSLVGELVHFPNQPSMLAFVGAFEYNPPTVTPISQFPWVIIFDNKGLFANTTDPLGHCFVSTLEDQGADAIFKANGEGNYETEQIKNSALEDFAVEVFPNPSKYGKVNIRANSDINKVCLYNLRGELVYNFDNGINAGKPSITLNISSLKSGLYMIQIEGAKETKFVKLVLK